MGKAPAEVKTTYRLEMLAESELRPKRTDRPGLDLRRVEIPSPGFSWFLHQSVGAAYRWGGRESWGPREWTDHVARPQLETWVVYVAGTPAGYFELEEQPDGSVRIPCFGLMEPFVGQGLGGHLLTEALARAWERSPSRVWLTTCSHDHPHALSNYLARGMTLVETRIGPANPPRESFLFAR